MSFGSFQNGKNRKRTCVSLESFLVRAYARGREAGARSSSWFLLFRRFGLQNLNLICSSNLRLSADSENPVPPSDPAP